MKRVAIESPYAGDIALHVAYAKAAVRDCLKRGESPYASHLFFTQDGILDDGDAAEGALGIEAGLAWGDAAEATVVYADLGISDGMKEGMARANAASRPIEMRSILSWTG